MVSYEGRYVNVKALLSLEKYVDGGLDKRDFDVIDCDGYRVEPTVMYLHDKGFGKYELELQFQTSPYESYSFTLIVKALNFIDVFMNTITDN